MYESPVYYIVCNMHQVSPYANSERAKSEYSGLELYPIEFEKYFPLPPKLNKSTFYFQLAFKECVRP